MEVRASPAATPPSPTAEAPAPATPDPPAPASARSATLDGLSRSIQKRAEPQHDAPALKTEPPPQGVSTLAPVAERDVDVRLDSVMSEANKAYDAKDFEEAKALANRVLATRPGNTRMLRILVSVACIDGDVAEAQRRVLELPASDRAAMRTRCSRDYGVTLSADGPRPK